MCGSGTIPIEAAMIAHKIPPILSLDSKIDTLKFFLFNYKAVAIPVIPPPTTTAFFIYILE